MASKKSPKQGTVGQGKKTAVYTDENGDTFVGKGKTTKQARKRALSKGVGLESENLPGTRRKNRNNVARAFALDTMDKGKSSIKQYNRLMAKNRRQIRGLTKDYNKAVTAGDAEKIASLSKQIDSKQKAATRFESWVRKNLGTKTNMREVKRGKRRGQLAAMGSTMDKKGRLH